MTMLQIITSWGKKSHSFLPKITLLLAPCDFLFPKLKQVVKETHFQDSKTIKTAVMREVQAILEEFFQEFVKVWQRRLEKFI